MSARFAELRQGKGPRHPRTVRPAFLLIGAGVAYSQIFYHPPVRADLTREVSNVRPVGHSITRKNAEPQLQVRMRLEEIEDSELAADLYGTILRSVRSARARREEEERHYGSSSNSPQAQRQY